MGRRWEKCTGDFSWDEFVVGEAPNLTARHLWSSSRAASEGPIGTVKGKKTGAERCGKSCGMPTKSSELTRGNNVESCL